MKLKRTLPALAALALVATLPVGAQTSSITVQAESMTLSSYVVEGGTRIKLSAGTGTASKTFSGASGTYKILVYVQPETDGRPTLEVYKGSTKVGTTYTYPSGTSATSFTLSNVQLSSGDTIKLVGRANGDAWARVDKVVFTRTGDSSVPSGPTVKTIEAESMALSSYAVENGNRIKLTAATGTASKVFDGAASNYKVQVQVIPETDGQSQLDVYKNAEKVKTFTYPKTTTATTFTIDSVALAPSDTLKLVGHANAGAWARVDKVVLTPTTVAPSTGGGDSTPPPESSACANPAGGYQGFGRNTTGGAGKPIYRVTNLNDSGAGSLRDAVSQGNRCVVFDVGGTISLASNLLVKGANVTIDGLTASSPGITLRNKTLVMQGSSGAGNLVVRGIRVRGTASGEDAIRIYGASNIVIDRVSASDAGDGAIDVTENARDVTIQWSILGHGPGFTSLIGYDASRITVHHNLYFNGSNRNPYCGRNTSGSVDNGWAGTTLAPEIVCDVRNNLVWNYKTHGTAVRAYAKANVINNYYYTTDSASAPRGVYIAEGGVAYTSGNFSKNGADLNHGNQSSAFATVAAPSTTDAVTAAKEILAKAGARGAKFGLDATDQGYVAQIVVE